MADLQIRSCVVGMVQTNCYVVWRGEGDCVLIDPGDSPERLSMECEKLGLTPKAILLTHGHFDHIMGAEALRQKYQIPVYAGACEQEVLESPEKMLSFMAGKIVSVKVDHWLSDGEELELCGMKWKTLFTPGHTVGSVCYYIEEEKTLFAGDTLFCESVGRTDFPTGSVSQLVASISNKLFALPDSVNVCPGHGEPTTIGHEKQANPVAACLR